MRRRSWGGRGTSGGRGEGAFEKLRAQRSGALRDLAALSFEGVPDGLELGSALFEGTRRIAVLASRRPGEDLIGWSLAAQVMGGPDLAPREVAIAAPFHSPRMREAALDLAAVGMRAHLIAVPALADPAEESFEVETFPPGGAPFDAHSCVYERVVSVLQGAAALTGCGGMRATSSGFALYLRGVLAARVRREAEGVAVSIVVPDRRRVFVNDENFPRWGVDLHEMVVQLAQDPRLGEVGATGADAERAAAEAGVRVTARWLPCSPDGALFVDWVGVDAQGCPHVGLVRQRVALCDAVALATARHLLGAERAHWAPCSRGIAALHAQAERIDASARELLDALSGATQAALPPRSVSIAAVAEPLPREEEVGDAPDADREERALEPGRERRGRRRGRRRRRGRGLGEQVSRPGSASGIEDADEAPGAEFEGEVADLAEESLSDLSEARETEDELETEVASGAESSAVEASEALENAEMLAGEVAEEEPAEEVAAESEPEPEEAPRELPRRRRARATLVVRNDADSILAGLVLARDRRSITSFRVIRQEDLIDYLKGPANDVPEADDLLLVGLTAQPHSREVLQIAELFRGRLQWFDHHAWLIEDVETLRSALGSESVLIEEVANPLPLVSEVTERRSRFTDKLVDLSARRLSENDMARWGYRMIGLIGRMAAHPGEHRSAIGPVLAGKPTELPAAESVYAGEARWMEQNDPRLVCFGEYELAVCEVPEDLDPGEVGRRVRASTGARLSLCARRGEDLVLLGCNEEKRPLNVAGLMEQLQGLHSWAHTRPSSDRVGRLWIDERSRYPERLETLIGELVRRRSALHA